MTPVPIQDAPQTNEPPHPTSGLLSHNPTTTTPLWTPSSIISTIPAAFRPTPYTASPVPFFHLLERLKTTKREGWRRFGINHGESISDHMYRMAIITMLAPRSLAARLDMARCTKMALVHDMAELLVGDITPVDGVLKSEKNRREATTMDYLCRDILGGVEGGCAGEEIRKVWQEYEDGVTLESQFVHDVDKMELVLQMLEYERAHGGRIDLGEFTWVAQRIELPEVREWCEQVLKERGDLWTQVANEPSGFLVTNEGENVVMSPQTPLQSQGHDEYYGASKVNGH